MSTNFRRTVAMLVALVSLTFVIAATPAAPVSAQCVAGTADCGPTYGEDFRYRLSTEKDKCGRPVIWIRDRLGSWHGVRKGEQSDVIELARNRFTWGCGWEADSRGHFRYTLEWATCPAGTDAIVARRAGGDSRRVWWDCMSQPYSTISIP